MYEGLDSTEVVGVGVPWYVREAVSPAKVQILMIFGCW